MKSQNKSSIWLKDAIIYQIYPSSFQDSNGDGIGDLKGITSRLDYLENLGINTIWICPCFESPFADGGYDISDFYKIAPRYGNKADLVELFKKAESRNIRILLDLVAGHTSIEHPWFKASASDPDNPEANRYIWKNRDFDPNEGPTEENFVHNFFWHQPALNFGYAKLTKPWQDSVDAPGPQKNIQTLMDIMAYWMNLGAAGFRVDMASSLVKEDPDHTETIKIWKRIRKWIDTTYPKNILIAEWSDPKEAIPAGFHLDFLIHFNCDVYRSLFFNEVGTIPYPNGSCYFDKRGGGTPWIFLNEYKEQLKTTHGSGYISFPTANHDFQHLRCGPRGWDELPVAWVFIMTQAGPPTIYMGDEIGMCYLPDIEPKEGSTLEGITAPNAGTAMGERAGTRTPMQWSSAKNAGFSSAKTEDLYLPLDPDPNRPTVESQEEDAKSLLQFVRKLIKIRKSNPALGSDASYEVLTPKEKTSPLVIHRHHPEQSVLICLNPTNETQSIEVLNPLPELHQLLNQDTSIEENDSKIKVTINTLGYAIYTSHIAS